MLNWDRIETDLLNGFSRVREEARGLFARSLTGSERARLRWAVYRLDREISAHYRELGESIYEHYLQSGEEGLRDRLANAEMKALLQKIQMRQDEKQKLLEEIEALKEVKP